MTASTHSGWSYDNSGHSVRATFIALFWKGAFARVCHPTIESRSRRNLRSSISTERQNNPIFPTYP